MNGVNLNAPELKVVRSESQLSDKALSSSPIQSENALERSSSVGVFEPVSGKGNHVRAGSVEKPEQYAGADRKGLNQAVSQLNDFVQNVQRDLQFEVDNEKGQTIVKVVDQQTKEVIRQIPDEVALRLAENLLQDEPVTLFNIKV
jgi:flagellar protein FlaG